MISIELQFGKAKDCYLHCSSLTLKSFTNRGFIQSLIVIVCQNKNDTGFNLALHIDESLCGNTVYINRYFADLLSFSEGTVFVEEAKDVAAISCLSLCCSVKDYSIVQLQYEYIEAELMNQIKVLAEGMPIIVWINASLSIRFSVCDVKPTHAILLNTYSKINVIEKGSRKEDNAVSGSFLKVQNNDIENCLLPKLSFVSDSTKHFCLPEVSMKCYCSTSNPDKELSLLSKTSYSKINPSKILCYLSHCNVCFSEQSSNLTLMADKSLFPYFVNNEMVILSKIIQESIEFFEIEFEFTEGKCKLSIPYLDPPNAEYSTFLWFKGQAWKFDLACGSGGIKVLKKKEFCTSHTKVDSGHYNPHNLVYESMIENILQSFMFSTKSFSLVTSNADCSGAGKTFLMNKLANDQRLINFFIVYKDATNLRGKRVENILKEITNILNTCCSNQTSIFLLDNLDAVLPYKSKNEDPSGDEIFGTRVAYKLNCIFEKFKNSNVEILISTKSLLTCHSVLMDALDTVYTIPLLSSSEQILFLETLVPSLAKNDLIFNWLSDLSLRSSLTAGEIIKLSHVLATKVLETSNSAPVELHQVCKVFDLRKSRLERGYLSISDCGGLSEVKKEINKMLILPFKYPGLISQIPFQLNRGLLLYGPPGVGKTHIVKAISNNLDMSFISVKGPELLNKYIGASEEAVRNLFRKAEEMSPTLIFFDEFDSLAPHRGNDTTGVMDRVVNQLLTELDGVSKKSGIFILAGSSRPDAIDSALLRPGRIGRYAFCPMPSLSERIEIWDCLLKNINHDTNVKSNALASKTETYSGADIKAIIYNAQLNLIKNSIGPNDDGIALLTQDNFLEAISDTDPSLSQSDLKNYDQKYRNFLTGSVSVGLKTTQK